MLSIQRHAAYLMCPGLSMSARRCTKQTKILEVLVKNTIDLENYSKMISHAPGQHVLNIDNMHYSIVSSVIRVTTS